LEKKTITGIMLTLLISSLFAANMVIVTAQEAHDIAVVSVTPSSTLVENGNLINITVVVKNQGDFNETFNLNCTFDENLISTETNITLNSGASKNVTFNWNTTGFYDHTSPQKIAATASTVSGETDTEDNSLVSSSRVRVFVSPYVGIVPHTTVNSNLTIGTNYTVSIYTDYNGSDITGYQFALSYNPNILNGVEVTNGDLIVGGSAMFLPGTFNNNAGELSVTGAFFFMAGEVVPGPGILANVTFTVVGLGRLCHNPRIDSHRTQRMERHRRKNLRYCKPLETRPFPSVARFLSECGCNPRCSCCQRYTLSNNSN